MKEITKKLDILWQTCGLLLFFLLVFPVWQGFSAPLESSRWGFRLDLPEDYEFTGGDGREKFSFSSTGGAFLDLAVYPAGGGGSAYGTVELLAEDTARRLRNRGERSGFEYRQKKAVLLELRFLHPEGTEVSGWGLCVELGTGGGNASQKGLLLVLAYGPASRQDLQIFHLSALDSISPAPEDRLAPGPVTEFGYPQGEARAVKLAGLDVSARIFDGDEEAAQALVDREFAVLGRYAGSPLWQQAWTRFYRAIYRDSFDRLAEAAFALERHWHSAGEAANRALAEKALAWVQTFDYERDPSGSDFVNLISAAVSGRGDCDSRALLWAIILGHADISSAIMVSREYSHAMGLAEIPGSGARFDTGGKKWLVAETTAKVALGLIAQDMSDPANWLGIIFE